MRFVLERKIVSEVHVKNILFEKKETHLSHNGRTNSGLCLYKVFFLFWKPFVVIYMESKL